MQRALVGEITPEMRAISVELKEREIRLRVFVDGGIPQADCDSFDAGVISQLIADFSQVERGDPSVDHEFIRVDEPAPVPAIGWLVFARAGTRFDRPD